MFDRQLKTLFQLLFFSLPILLTANLAFSGVVTQDGAFVFSEPSFDAEVLTNLKKGTSLKLSKKIYGSYGKFYQIRIPQGIGYIAIIDVDPNAKGGKKLKKKKKKKNKKKLGKKKKKKKEKNAKKKKRKKKKLAKKKKKKKKKRKSARDLEEESFLDELNEDDVVDMADDDDNRRKKKRRKKRRKKRDRDFDDDFAESDDDDAGDIFEDADSSISDELESRGSDFRRRSRNSTPLYFQNMIGGFIGYYNYQENIEGLDAKANLPLIGFRMTGPEILFTGPVLDLNVAISFGAPKYYEDIASAKPSGFALIADLSFVFPISQMPRGLIYATVGPLLHFSKYSVVVTPIGGDDGDSVNFDLQEAKVGAVIGAGYGHRFGAFVTKLDLRVYVERKTYFGVGANLQYLY